MDNGRHVKQLNEKLKELGKKMGWLALRLGKVVEGEPYFLVE